MGRQVLKVLSLQPRNLKNPDRKQDIQDYVTVIYAYRGEESRFYELYSTYPKVIDKFKLMRPIVEKYEIANGIK